MKKIIALLLALVMLLGLVACGSKSESAGETTEESALEEPTRDQDVLVVGYSYFSQKFSPFFAQTSYDRDAAEMTQLKLLDLDREGNMILNGIAGETKAYNGTEYQYKGIADCEIIENADGTVDYNFTMRDDIVFSDGTPMTADDAIFSMYVLCDPTYDGSSTLYALPIAGLEEYRAGMSTLSSLILADYAAGTSDFSEFYTEAQYSAYIAALEAAMDTFVQEIIDYCVAIDAESLPTVAENEVALGMMDWGFGAVNADGTFTDAMETTYDMTSTFPTKEDFAKNLLSAYDNDLASLSDTESAGSSLTDLMAETLGTEAEAYSGGVSTGDSAASISGIQKTGEFTFTIRTTKVDAAAINQMALDVAPMHYYGDASLYDYDNDQFGFVKGDLSKIRSATKAPMGAGPYKFLSYENAIITFEANENYYKGTPKIKNILFKEGPDADKLTGVAQGTFDISDPSFSAQTVEYLKGYNPNGALTGEVITTTTVDNLGYGYIGINANNVKVGDDQASDASRNLRRAISTLLAVYRDTVIDSYYGDRAAVIQYPISNTSWAAPKPADEGYTIAYSTDVEGNAIYTEDMTEQEKYQAALDAAIGFLKAAGYTWDDAAGIFTAAPEGAAMTYTAIIPADGSGDHPAFGVLTAAKEALSTVGITLDINDVSDTNILWDSINAGTIEMWAAAWSATSDPDMYQVYYSGNVVENSGGSKSNNYHLQDTLLDELMVEARSSTDQSFRKSLYKECLDIIMGWSCEVPVYQRQNAVIFSSERVNMETVTPDITTFWGWMHDLENLEMN